MKRPQHKKNKSNFPEAEAEAAEIDERNLIDAEASAEIAIEDRISMYWMENKAFVAGCIAVLVLVIVGVNGYRIYGNYVTDNKQSQYREAQAEDTLENFAVAYADQSLGGFAALNIADEAYEKAEFERARDFYLKAVASLKDPVLTSRARLGEAFALNESGDSAGALALLGTLATDATATEVIRAEALYHLAVAAHIDNREADFESFSKQIEDLSKAGAWQQRLQQIR
jgi:predicted negative regulator of RcsB-dependent stress response